MALSVLVWLPASLALGQPAPEPTLPRVLEDAAVDEQGRITGAHLPPGSHVLPIRALDTVRFSSLGSDGVAVILPAASTAWVFDPLAGDPMPLPLESAARAMPDDRALGATVSLRAMRSCPVSRTMCALYGPPRAVRRAADPVKPLGGFFLRQQPVETAPAGLAYVTERHDSPFDGVSLRVDETRTAAGELVEVVILVVDERETDAYAAIHPRGVLDVAPPGLTARGPYLYVYGGTHVSIHDRATGRRIRQYGAVSYEPYYDVCLAGDDGIWVVPVLRGPAVGFALFFEGSRTAVYYDDLGGAPRRVPLQARDEVLYGAAHVHGRMVDGRLRIVPSVIDGW